MRALPAGIARRSSTDLRLPLTSMFGTSVAQGRDVTLNEATMMLRFRTVLRRSCGFGPLVVATTLAACATNPVTGEKQFALMSEAEEIQMGRQLDQQVRQEMGVYNDPDLQRYVEEIGLELARSSHRPNLPWSFAIVNSPAINAFALPGGFIYLTRGIMAYLGDEAELAGVLGHEIGHVTARHSVEQYSRATGANLGLTVASIFFPGARPYADLASMGLGILFLKHGRDDEMQADRLGAEYAAKSGWDPSGVTGMLRTLGRLDENAGGDRRGVPGWLATHPEPAARVAQVDATVQQARSFVPDGTGAVRREDYLRRIDGLMYGDDPSEGVVRGNAFLHADLRFALRFPEGWEVVNAPQQVVANEPGTNNYVVMDLVQDAGSARSLADIAQRSMQGAGFRSVAQGGSTRFNGLDAWVGTYQGQLQNIGPVVARVAVILHERNVYRLIGFAPKEAFSRVEPAIADAQASFRPLSREEARDIRPNRVDLYTVRPGDTWQSIAQRAGRDNVRPATLAILNGFPPEEQPRAGDRVKIVVEG
jgi:predicted Zn-dependent protease